MRLTFSTPMLGVRLAAALAATRQVPHGSASVDLSLPIGETKFLGSGFIYGWPDNGIDADDSIPEYLIRDMNFNACRAGGAQLPAPALGWTSGGYDGYIGRFESTLSNYRTTRKYGGDFILLPHDLWGADGGLDGLYPGDDGDWSQMESFYDQLISDLKTNNMLEAMVFDIWNEPELEIFWARSWDQYLEYYVRAHKIIRAKLPDTLISGPSGAHSPALDQEQWNLWMAHIATNDAVPDIYSWHQIGAWEREPDSTIPDFNALRERYGLPERPIDINEYAWPDEQNPANTAWYLAQLERHDLRGLRANWGSGSGLHDLMADLVFRSNNTYYPNGEWYLYNYYAQMSGKKVATTASSDLLFDVFATTSKKGAKVIAGTRTVQAPYELTITGLTALGLPEEGSVRVRALQFNWTGKSSDTGGPVELGTSSLSYSKDKLTILVDPPSNSTAFAYELLASCV